jgi:hypothetical protein
LAGPESRDRDLAELVDELSLHSTVFRRLWARQDVAVCTGGVVFLAHPKVGRLELNYERLDIVGTPGHQVALYHAVPNGESARSLAQLADLTHGSPGSASAQACPGHKNR